MQCPPVLPKFGEFGGGARRAVGVIWRNHFQHPRRVNWFVRENASARDSVRAICTDNDCCAEFSLVGLDSDAVFIGNDLVDLTPSRISIPAS
jgi:hypothetical protein